MVSSSLHSSITELSEQSQIPASNDPTPFSLPHGSAATLTFLGSARAELAGQAQVPGRGRQFPDKVWDLGVELAAALPSTATEALAEPPSWEFLMTSRPWAICSCRAVVEHNCCWFMHLGCSSQKCFK